MIATPAVPSIADFVHPPHAEKRDSLQQRLTRMLRAIRMHLGMDVAFVSEFTKGHRVFRCVDSLRTDQPVRVGGSDPLGQSYCQRVVDGRLPELMPDTALFPEAGRLPVTAALPVGAHLSIPITMSDGRVYGTFCCFSFAPDPSLNRRDLRMMRVFAELAAEQIEEELDVRRAREESEHRIASVLSGNSLSVVYQPIYHFAENRIVGFESLSRFSATPIRSPDAWFNEAAEVGLGVALEIRALQLALQGLNHLPQEMYVSVNLSPETILAEEIDAVLDVWPLKRIVLEVTEHAAIAQYSEIVETTNALRSRGLRIAVDDAGAGYASFRHILSLTPDVIKLDMSITRNVDSDPSRRALARALIGFADATEARIVAEGVESASELATLRELGVNKAQGYFIGKPVPIAVVAQLAREGLFGLALETPEPRT